MIMKKAIYRILLLALPQVMASALTSCVTEYEQSTRLDRPARTGHKIYSALPPDYSGDAYYHNNLYYAGGRYEPGTYSHNGRTYDHRYLHDGNYLYGGDYHRQTISSSYRGRSARPTSTVQFVTYQTLPRDYSGDTYYHNNRYHAGGRYEPGTYSHNGRTYSQRYFHNGNYLYGGDYRRSGFADSSQRFPRSTPTYRSTRRSH